MKRLTPFIILLGISFTSYSQAQNDVSLLKTWKLKTHTMSGIGKHNSLTENAQLQFFGNGTWKCTSLWEGASEGKWSLKNENRTLHIFFASDNEKDFRVAALTNEELQLEHTSKLAVYKLTWQAVK